jgi:hypothetical protein
MKKALLVCFVLATLPGCLKEKERAFFADTGITVGEPKAVDDSVFIPIMFKTRIVHSAQWLYDVRWSEGAGSISITAVFNVPPGERKSVYPGGITLKNPERETYKLLYQDPDGKTHDLGEVKLPQR